MSHSVDYPVAIITGAAGGIGQAIVLDLLNKNYKIAMLDKNSDALKLATNQITKYKDKIKTYVLDITDEDQVSNIISEVSKDFGRIDVLVNNAGILKDELLLKVKEDSSIEKFALSDWEKVIKVNLTGVFLCAREAALQMIKHKKKGIIINMSSLAKCGNFGQSSYSSTKAGVEALTVTWAQELARYNIRVAGVAPGVVATQMTAGMKPKILEALCKKNPCRQAS